MATWIESIDVNAYVQGLMKKEADKINEVKQYKLNQLNAAESALKSQVSAYGQLQNLLSTFQNNVTSLTNAFKPNFQVTSSNTAVATAAINGSVAPGNHTVNVTQLAQAEQVASATTFANSSTALNMTNTLSISAGSVNINVNVGSGDTLQNIADNINTAASVNNANVFASVVSTGTNQYRLVIASSQSGVANAVNISETGTGANALNISTGAGGTGQILTQAQDAQFTYDSLSYSLPTNTTSIAGLNISLLSLGTSTFSVTQTDSVNDVNQAAQNVVNSYNQIMTFIAQTQAQQTAPDPITKLRGTNPDPVLSLIQSSLTNIMSNSSVLTNLGITALPYNQVQPINVSTVDGQPITIHPTGLLTIAADPITGETLSDKLAANFSNIQTQLVGSNGVLTQVGNLLTPSTGGIWKALNDPQYGSEIIANTKIGQLDDQIASIKSDAENRISNLVKKYAKLDVVLLDLQKRAQVMTQQLAAMDFGKSK